MKLKLQNLYKVKGKTLKLIQILVKVNTLTNRKLTTYVFVNKNNKHSSITNADLIKEIEDKDRVNINEKKSKTSN